MTKSLTQREVDDRDSARLLSLLLALGFYRFNGESRPPTYY